MFRWWGGGGWGEGEWGKGGGRVGEGWAGLVRPFQDKDVLVLVTDRFHQVHLTMHQEPGVLGHIHNILHGFHVEDLLIHPDMMGTGIREGLLEDDLVLGRLGKIIR